MSRYLPLAILLAMLPGCGDGASGAVDPSLVHTVARADLHVTVTERADIRAADDTRVKSKVEGRATLKFLIQEGVMVEQGQLVAELDASELEAKAATEAIAVARAEAAYDQAVKNNEIVEAELEALENTAQSRLDIARIRREKFIGRPRAEQHANEGTDGTNAAMLKKLNDLIVEQYAGDAELAARFSALNTSVRTMLGSSREVGFEMGEMANQILTQIDEINLSRAEFELAAETLFHSRSLQEKNFITKNELERDIINHNRQRSKVTVSWNNLQILINYTLREQLITLDQEIENAELGLRSQHASSEARRVRETAELRAAKSELDLGRERLANYRQQVANARFEAPTPGLVVYGRYDWDEPVYEGMSVREGQDIVIIPDIRHMFARLRVHEAQIDQVAIGQPAKVTIDAFPGRVFGATVQYVATLPEPTRRSTDTKVYEVRVLLDGDNPDGEVRPGMNGSVRIDVGVLEDVISVPVPAVKRRDEAHYVWLLDGDLPVPRRVTLGRNNLTHVEVLAGLDVGDRIRLVPPTGRELPDPDGTSYEGDPDATDPDATDADSTDPDTTDGDETNGTSTSGTSTSATPTNRNGSPRQGDEANATPAATSTPTDKQGG
jgi:RND family efflux transporter MFP subunit